MIAQTTSLETSGDQQATLDWMLEHFPVIYKHNEPQAVLVDITVFKHLVFLLENLPNRTAEPEDAMLADSPELQHLAQWVRTTARPTPHWEQVLNEL